MIAPPSGERILGSDYSLQFDFRCGHAAPASGNLPSFMLVLSFNIIEAERLRYAAINVDCRDRYLSVEHTSGDEVKNLFKVPHRSGLMVF